MARDTGVDVEAVMGAATRRPLVAMSLGSGCIVRMTPPEAVEVAVSLITAASSALSDAAAVDALGGERLTTEEVAEILLRLRSSRAAVEGREGT